MFLWWHSGAKWFSWLLFFFDIMFTMNLGHGTRLSAPFRERCLKSFSLFIVDVETNQVLVDSWAIMSYTIIDKIKWQLQLLLTIFDRIIDMLIYQSPLVHCMMVIYVFRYSCSHSAVRQHVAQRLGSCANTCPSSSWSDPHKIIHSVQYTSYTPYLVATGLLGWVRSWPFIG